MKAQNVFLLGGFVGFSLIAVAGGLSPSGGGGSISGGGSGGSSVTNISAGRNISVAGSTILLNATVTNTTFPNATFSGVINYTNGANFFGTVNFGGQTVTNVSTIVGINNGLGLSLFGLNQPDSVSQAGSVYIKGGGVTNSGSVGATAGSVTIRGGNASVAANTAGAVYIGGSTNSAGTKQNTYMVGPLVMDTASATNLQANAIATPHLSLTNLVGDMLTFYNSASDASWNANEDGNNNFVIGQSSSLGGKFVLTNAYYAGAADGVSNVPSSGIVNDTSVIFASATNTLNVQNSYQVFIASTDVAITNTLRIGSCYQSHLIVSNSSGSAINLKWLAPGHAGVNSTNSLSIGGGKVGEIWVMRPLSSGITNYLSNLFQ